MLAIDTRNSQAHFRKVCAELVKQITHSVLFFASNQDNSPI